MSISLGGGPSTDDPAYYERNRRMTREVENEYTRAGFREGDLVAAVFDQRSGVVHVSRLVYAEVARPDLGLCAWWPVAGSATGLGAWVKDRSVDCRTCLRWLESRQLTLSKPTPPKVDAKSTVSTRSVPMWTESGAGLGLIDAAQEVRERAARRVANLADDPAIGEALRQLMWAQAEEIRTVLERCDKPAGWSVGSIIGKWQDAYTTRPTSSATTTRPTSAG